MRFFFIFLFIEINFSLTNPVTKNLKCKNKVLKSISSISAEGSGTNLDDKEHLLSFLNKYHLLNIEGEYDLGTKAPKNCDFRLVIEAPFENLCFNLETGPSEFVTNSDNYFKAPYKKKIFRHSLIENNYSPIGVPIPAIPFVDTPIEGAFLSQLEFQVFDSNSDGKIDDAGFWGLINNFSSGGSSAAILQDSRIFLNQSPFGPIYSDYGIHLAAHCEDLDQLSP